MDELHSHQTGAKPWAWSFVIEYQFPGTLQHSA